MRRNLVFAAIIVTIVCSTDTRAQSAETSDPRDELSDSLRFGGMPEGELALPDLVVHPDLEFTRVLSGWGVLPKIVNVGPADSAKFDVKTYLFPKFGPTLELVNEWPRLAAAGSPDDNERAAANRTDIPHVCYAAAIVIADPRTGTSPGGKIIESDETNNSRSFIDVQFKSDLDFLLGDAPVVDPSSLVLVKSTRLPAGSAFDVAEFVVKNDGDETLILEPVFIDGTDRNLFSIIDPTNAGDIVDQSRKPTIASNKEMKFRVQYSPPSLRRNQITQHRARVIVDGSHCGVPLEVELTGVTF